jgi:hypothetical protein
LVEIVVRVATDFFLILDLMAFYGHTDLVTQIGIAHAHGYGEFFV